MQLAIRVDKVLQHSPPDLAFARESKRGEGRERISAKAYFFTLSIWTSFSPSPQAMRFSGPNPKASSSFETPTYLERPSGSTYIGDSLNEMHSIRPLYASPI